MRRYDLNLLVALDALLRERSVSVAARRVGIGQPAMSAALARLRSLFNDPLLVRSAGEMEPTPRALQLSGPLREALSELLELIEPAPAFDPATARRTFRVSGGDYVGITVLPRLAEALRREAPRVDLRFRYLEKDAALAALQRNTLDLALLVMESLPPQFESDVLIEETFVGTARRDHPIFKATITAARFAGFDHLLVTENADATGCVDDALAATGLSRRIALTVPSTALVGDILRGTDLVATVAGRAGRRMAEQGGVELFEPPVAMPGWAMRAVWNARDARDPALQWLRGQLATAVAATEDRTGTD